MALTSVIDLWVMWVDFGYWSIWNFGNDYFSQGVVDGAWALAYLAVSVFGFLAASRLWAYERSGWLIANAVAFAWLALDYLGMLLWPPDHAEHGRSRRHRGHSDRLEPELRQGDLRPAATAHLENPGPELGCDPQSKPLDRGVSI